MSDDTIGEIVDLLHGNLTVAKDQLLGLAELVVQSRKGILTIPSTDEFLRVSLGFDQKKTEYAMRYLQSILASTIVPQGEVPEPTLGLKIRLGREVNKLGYLIGDRNGKPLVAKALGKLAENSRVQWLLLVRSMGTNLKQELGYPDLEECSPEQYGDYIRSAANVNLRSLNRFDRNQLEIVGISPEKSSLILTLTEGLFDRPHEFIDGVLTSILLHKNFGFVFSCWILAAEQEELLDELEDIFNHTSDTATFAQQCATRSGKLTPLLVKQPRDLDISDFKDGTEYDLNDDYGHFEGLADLEEDTDEQA